MFYALRILSSFFALSCLFSPPNLLFRFPSPASTSWSSSRPPPSGLSPCLLSLLWPHHRLMVGAGSWGVGRDLRNELLHGLHMGSPGRGGGMKPHKPQKQEMTVSSWHRKQRRRKRKQGSERVKASFSPDILILPRAKQPWSTTMKLC